MSSILLTLDYLNELLCPYFQILHVLCVAQQFRSAIKGATRNKNNPSHEFSPTTIDFFMVAYSFESRRDIPQLTFASIQFMP